MPKTKTPGRGPGRPPARPRNTPKSDKKRIPSKEEIFDETSRDSIASFASSSASGVNDEKLAVLTAAQPDEGDVTPMTRIDPSAVEFYVQRCTGLKTIAKISDSSKLENQKRPELTLLYKEKSGDTEDDLIHVRDYIRLIRIAVRKLIDKGEEQITIGLIDKFIQNNFWIEGSDMADLSHQLRLAVGRGK